MSNYSYWMFLGFINQLLTGGHRIAQDFGMKVWTWFHDRDWSLMNSEATGLGEKYRIQEKIGKLSIKHGPTFHSQLEWTNRPELNGIVQENASWTCLECFATATPEGEAKGKHRWCYQKAPRSLASNPRYLWYLLPTCNYHWKLRQVPLFLGSWSGWTNEGGSLPQQKQQQDAADSAKIQRHGLCQC